MRRTRVTTASAVRPAALTALTALVASVALVAGCARSGTPAVTGARPAGTAAAVPQGGGQQADIYEAVLRRYLGTPAENSFPGRTFKTVYVLNRAFADAADPTGRHGRGEPVGAE